MYRAAFICLSIDRVLGLPLGHSISGAVFRGDRFYHNKGATAVSACQPLSSSEKENGVWVMVLLPQYPLGMLSVGRGPVGSR